MKDRKKMMGLLVMVLAFGMMVNGCDLTDDDPSDVISMDPLPGTISITGTWYVGQTLTVNTSNLGGNGAISYQWSRRDTAESFGNSISNATGANYTLTETDLGKYIYVVVKRPSHFYGKTSDNIGPITAGPPLTGTVSITGTAKVGQTLNVNTTSLGGSGTISYQWKRGDTAGAVNTNITNSTENTYLVTGADFGKYIAVSVTRSGYGSNVTSTAIGPVTDAMTWVQVSNSIFGTTSVNGVAYNGINQWVAVGDRGILAYSSNGENWTKVDLSSSAFDPTGTSSTYSHINSIAYGNGTWIAVGSVGKAASSTNGTTWSAISGFGQAVIFRAVAYGNNRWVIGDYNGRMYTSTDNGITWPSITNHPFGYDAINSIAYGNNRWIAVGASGKMATSTDGQNWTAVDVASIFTYLGSTVAIQTVAYANNLWVAAGTGGIMATSTNGTTWSAVTGNAFSTATIQSVAYGNNKWVASGGFTFGLMPSRIVVSSDGRNWSSIANTTFGDDQIKGIAFGNNKWVAVGDNSKIAYANDN